MPLNQKWLPSGLLHISYNGEVTAKELVESTIGLSSDPRFDNLKTLISDWTDPGNADLQFAEDEIRQLVAYMRSLAISNPRIRLAGVLNPDNKNRWEMVRFFETLTDVLRWDIKIFDSWAEAQTWLGVDYDISA